MANLEIKDGAAAQKYVKATGAGSNGDPFIPEHKESSAAAILAAQATAANQATAITGLASLLTELQLKADLTETQPVSVSGGATAANQTAAAVLVGAVTETAPATDTASSGLNGRLQRIAQRITSLLALIPAALTGSGNFKVAVQEALPAGTATIGGTLDAGHGLTTAKGVSGAAVVSPDASAGVNITDAPASGQKLVIVDLVFSTNVDMQIDFKTETTGTVHYTFYAKAGTIMQFTPRSKWKLDTADKKLIADTSVAGACSFTPHFYSEA